MLIALVKTNCENKQFKIKQNVEDCQDNFQQFVENSSMANFGDRLKEAFQTNQIAEIARKLSISYQAAKNYVEGRIPDAEKLKEISDLTNCSIHWLLTGEGSKSIVLQTSVNLDDVIDAKILSILDSNHARKIIRDMIETEVNRGGFAKQISHDPVNEMTVLKFSQNSINQFDEIIKRFIPALKVYRDGIPEWVEQIFRKMRLGKVSYQEFQNLFWNTNVKEPISELLGYGDEKTDPIRLLRRFWGERLDEEKEITRQSEENKIRDLIRDELVKLPKTGAKSFIIGEKSKEDEKAA